MSNIERQLNAIMRFLTAETAEDRNQACADMREMMGVKVAPRADVLAHVENIIMDALLDLGVPCHIKGYRYLIDAVRSVVENPDIINAITSVLYPVVAKAHNTTGSRVERAIRHAIECGWDRGDIDTLQSYFGNTVSRNKCKPTNSEFISLVANVVLRRMREAV